ncbi:MAG TPA: response regulator [Bacteroidota bacterium]|jgi:DNA-binding NtrC family response regulator|nr:response regulator [Bacteroidota bacterium]
MNSNNEGIKGFVILMDDDESIREIAKEIINAIGYDVITATNGEELITLYKDAISKNIKVTAVILDLTVPGGMGGKEAIKKLIEIDPNVYGIVSSGYSNDPIMSHYKVYGFKDVIVKPYRIEEMEDVLTKANK